MFVLDFLGYSAFKPEEWFPHPDCYLASFDKDADLWCLVMEDATNFATHCVHENPFNWEQVKAIIPGLVDQAVKFEGTLIWTTPRRPDEVGVSDGNRGGLHSNLRRFPFEIEMWTFPFEIDKEVEPH